jgi:hypothetical protein
MLLMNPHPYYVRINPFEEPETIGRIEDELRVRGGAPRAESGETFYGFRSFASRDAILEGLRARFGRACAEAEDGPYYRSAETADRLGSWRTFDVARGLPEEATALL